MSFYMRQTLLSHFMLIYSTSFLNKVFCAECVNLDISNRSIAQTHVLDSTVDSNISRDGDSG